MKRTNTEKQMNESEDSDDFVTNVLGYSAWEIIHCLSSYASEDNITSSTRTAGKYGEA